MNFLSNFTATGADGVTPGLGSTEFWLSAATILLTISDVFGAYKFTPDQKAAVLAAVPIVYVLCRSVIKAVAAMQSPTPPVAPKTAK